MEIWFDENGVRLSPKELTRASAKVTLFRLAWSFDHDRPMVTIMRWCNVGGKGRKLVHVMHQPLNPEGFTWWPSVASAADVREIFEAKGE